MKAIFDGLIVLPNEIVNGHVLMYEKDIWRIVPRKQFRAGMCSEFIDANGGFVVPGFINEHIHGCAGVESWMTMNRPCRPCRRPYLRRELHPLWRRR